MIPLPSRSPFTGGEIIVTRFYCPESNTSVDGQFSVSNPFAQLSREQLEFIELFVRSEGRISRMEGELALSYPTIRSRLKEIIAALGYDSADDTDVDPEPDDSEVTGKDPGQQGAAMSKSSLAKRKKIIKKLDEGKISFEEAMRQVDALD